MLTIIFNDCHPPSNDLLVSDFDIEDFLLDHHFNSKTNLNYTVDVYQISIIYVLRQLIAKNKINCEDVIVMYNDVVYNINHTGRFDKRFDYVDLFDKSLNAILSHG